MGTHIPRLREEFEVLGFMAQKGLWNIAKKKSVGRQRSVGGKDEMVCDAAGNAGRGVPRAPSGHRENERGERYSCCWRCVTSMAAAGSRSSEMQCDFLPFGVGVRQNDTEEVPLVKSGRRRRREGQSNGWSRRRHDIVSQHLR